MDQENNQKITTRFAPSPTGFLHVGGVRTALFSYIFAKQHQGNFILRIEDTDKERSKSEYEVDIVQSIDWLKLDYGNIFYRQSEREDLYKKYLKKLIDSGFAYVSKEEIKKEGDRSEVIRFKNPNKKVTFDDLIRGTVEFDSTDLGDFVIAKSLTEPLYHLAVIVDDHEMKVTHIVRGEEHLSNTPRQILLQEALDMPRQIYAHLPLILAPDKSKLSKRKHGEKVALHYYMQQGYLPEAVINYLALLGWNPGTDQEIFTFEELIKTFDLSRVQKSGAIFDEVKLRWINKQHMLRLPQTELYARIKEALGDLSIPTGQPIISGELFEKLVPVILERVETFSDIKTMMAAGEFDYVFSEPAFESSSLLWKGKGDLTDVKRRLEKVIELISEIKDTNFTKDTVKNAVWDFAGIEGRGEVLWPMRFALSGKEKSPDPFVLSELLGKNVTIERLNAACQKIS